MNKEYSYDFLRLYFPNQKWQVHSGQSGMNNTTRFVDVEDSRYVLRIYETHQDIEKVQFEHKVLLELKKHITDLNIPEPIATVNGNTIVRLQDGKIAALFIYLEGISPSAQGPLFYESFGRVTGLLLTSLEKVNVPLAHAYSPYYEIENTHPRCTPQDVSDFCMNPPSDFINDASALQYINEQLNMIQKNVTRLKKLPHQLVHGDLNTSNILANSLGEVTAVLDFEFVTYDLRVIELAVCLSGLIKANEAGESLWRNIEDLLSGFGKNISLNKEEVSCIPLLIQLRNLDIFIHFLGRYRDGIDPIDIVKERLSITCTRNQWVTANHSRLLELCMQYTFTNPNEA